MAWWMLQSPNQLPVYAGLGDADKAAVSSALQAGGIAYSIDDSSGNITVAEDDVHKARILLAGEGLPKAAPAGDALLSNLPLGASRALENDTLRGAREADLARTIEGIETIKTARVMLAKEDDSPFLRDESSAAASVMLTLENGRSLDEAQVKAIRFLVASSVPGLQPSEVSIVDQSGTLLSDTMSTSEDRNLDLQQRTEKKLQKSIAALLTPVLGSGNFSTAVHADLDFSESQSTRESYPKEDRALILEQGNKSTTSETGQYAIGIPGAVSNQPPSASQVANTPNGAQSSERAANSGESAKSYSRKFDVGREISVTHQPIGNLRRVTVAVAVKAGKKPLSAAARAQIEALIKGAVGFSAERGDTVAVSSQNFVAVAAESEQFWDAPWFVALLRQLGGLVAAVLVLAFVARPMLKRIGSMNGERNAKALEEGLLGSLPDRTDKYQPEANVNAQSPITLEMIKSAPAYEQRAALVRAFVRQDPDRAALVMRSLMEAAQ